MSWSVNASGRPESVNAELDRQFSYPLAEGPRGLLDIGEKETVRLTKEMITQCLKTFDPDVSVTVAASGHMGWQSHELNIGAKQTVNLSIEPGN